MTFPAEAYKNKPIYEGPFCPSAHTVREIDVATGAESETVESKVLGQFVVCGVFNPFKSTSDNWVYDETIFCRIKINDAYNKDVAAHAVVPGTAKAKLLMTRFPTAWARFESGRPKKDGAAEESAQQAAAGSEDNDEGADAPNVHLEEAERAAAASEKAQNEAGGDKGRSAAGHSDESQNEREELLERAKALGIVGARWYGTDMLKKKIKEIKNKK